MASANRKLSDIVGERIEESIRGTTLPVLPTLTELCRIHKVSRPTVIAAARTLRDKGLLDFRPGMRMRVVGRPSTEERSAEALFQELRDKITGGVYRVGERLPKVGYFVLQKGVSNHTVLDVYHRLIQEDLVTKRGKAWIAGPQGRRTYEPSVRPAPVVVVVQKHEYSWGSMGRDDRTMKFCRTFNDEAEKHGMQLMFVVALPESFHGYSLAAGEKQIVALIRDLGPRYAGALIAFGKHDGPDVEHLAQGLVKLGRPVVWFDRYGEKLDCPIEARHFTRCHFAQGEAEQLAVRYLASMGHIALGYWDYNGVGWRTERGRLLETLCAEQPNALSITWFPPALQLINETADADLWEHYRSADQRKSKLGTIFDSMVSRYPHLRSALRQRNIGGARRDRYGKLVDMARLVCSMEFADFCKNLDVAEYDTSMTIMTPLCMHMLASGCTAIVAPNDSDARHLYVWASAADVRIPRDLSLLSFDNYWLLQQLPVTSVDFGFGYLGYCAFHAILRDIPVKRDRRGDVRARPYLAGRGSVGPPRKHA